MKKASSFKELSPDQLRWTLDINDIPKAVLALSKAYEYLVMGDGAAESADSAEAGGVE